jgi:hypothetical protein
MVWWENKETEQTIWHWMKGVVEGMVEAVSKIMFVGVEMLRCQKLVSDRGSRTSNCATIPYAKMTLVNPRMSKREGE